MTSDELVAQLARCRKRNAELRAHNTKLWQSNQEWHRRQQAHRAELERLRTRVRDLRRSRDMWRERAPKAQSVRRTDSRNLELSRADIDRILGMQPRV